MVVLGIVLRVLGLQTLDERIVKNGSAWNIAEAPKVGGPTPRFPSVLSLQGLGLGLVLIRVRVIILAVEFPSGNSRNMF